MTTLTYKTAFYTQFGFDPDYIYCQSTGKPLGYLFESEFSALLASVGAAQANADIESTCDDLYVRLLASMRPSMHWNVTRIDTIPEMRKRVPHETLAYLLNQLLATPRAKATDMLDDLGERIVYWPIIAALSEDQVDSLLYMLIEWDAKWGLTKELPPILRANLFDGDPVENLKRHYHARLDDWDIEQRSQARWQMMGATRSRRAHFEMFLEGDKPNRVKLIRDEKKREAKRERVTKNVEKKQELAMFDSLLDEILVPGNAPKPTPAPVKTAPKLRLGKINLAVKKA